MNEWEEREKLREIKEELPEQCKNCSFLEATDLRNKKVHCPYLVKEECLVGGIYVKKVD